jgi:hypothetical protein
LGSDNRIKKTVGVINSFKDQLEKTLICVDSAPDLKLGELVYYLQTAQVTQKSDYLISSKNNLYSK